LRIKDEELKPVDSALEWLAKVISGEGKSEGVVEEYSSSVNGSERSSEDSNPPVHQPNTHTTTDPTCLAILSILKKCLCFCYD